MKPKARRKFVRLFPFLSFAWFLLAPYVQATPNQPSVKVALFSAKGAPRSIIVLGPFIVQGRHSFTVPSGRFRLASDNGFVQLIPLTDGRRAPVLIRDRTVLLKPVGAASVRIEQGGNAGVRSYKGVLSASAASDFSVSRAPLSVINDVPRREYLAGVVASEMPKDAPLEALKALAVLANTQVARLLPAHSLKDSTEHEAYGGVPPLSRSAAYAAVDAVGNEILRKNGHVSGPFFHSTCAGMTSKSADIFGAGESGTGIDTDTTNNSSATTDTADDTTNVKCTNCSSSPFYKELTTKIPRRRFDTVFGARLPDIISTDVAGRPTKVTYTFKGRRLTTSGYRFWLHLGQEFGWDKAPGTNFSLRAENGQILVKSRGAGHGVGLCQWGAIGMAKRGSSYRDILSAYFPGATISK
jgi:stage II sporulation protein D